jgi:phosphoribosylaminoimidazolecarboxamide formyltransferase/IMP cyclohydrolase
MSKAEPLARKRLRYRRQRSLFELTQPSEAATVSSLREAVDTLRAALPRRNGRRDGHGLLRPGPRRGGGAAAAGRRALISVSDKTGLVELSPASRLRARRRDPLHRRHREAAHGGGHSRHRGLEHTGFPEIMGGRVKTLHPRIHGGILGRRGIDDGVMRENEIKPIDLVVVNLYPFEQTVAKPDCDLPTAIENIDIGGPAMLRAAAKNHAAVTVVVDAADYTRVLDERWRHNGEVSDATRFDLAVKAFEHTAAYDGAIANYLGAIVEHPRASRRPAAHLQPAVPQGQAMRYGENPHQQAAFYAEREAVPASSPAPSSCRARNSATTTSPTPTRRWSASSSSTTARLRHRQARQPLRRGLSATACWRPTSAPSPPTRSRPSAASSPSTASWTPPPPGHRRASSSSRSSSRPRSAPRPRPSRRRRTCACSPAAPGPTTRTAMLDFKRVAAACWCRTADLPDRPRSQGRQPPRTDRGEMRDLLFAWRVAKFVKSNAIVYGRDGRPSASAPAR